MGEARTEREIIEEALAETRGRISGRAGGAAKLSIPASTLASRTKTLKINRHQFKSLAPLSVDLQAVALRLPALRN
jgi:hypothetical protein